MGRVSIATRTHAALSSAKDALDDTPTRVVTLGGGVTAGLVAHALLDDAQFAWIAAPLVLLAGLSGGARLGLIVGVVAAVGHLGVDLLVGGRFVELPGIAVRSVVLIGIGPIGAAGALIERQRHAAMQRAVREDPVTGLLNVRAFYDELEALREQERPFAILLADIRGMRSLNDRYGHPTGTEAMRALAHVLRRSAGVDVVASRLGSDELAVALVGEERDRCRSVVGEIIERLHNEQVTLPDGSRFEVHAAYGIARYPEDGEDEVAVLRAADRAKDRAKDAGLDRVGTASGDVL